MTADAQSAQLRRWIVAGLGALIGMTILLYALLELMHPGRSESARNFLEIALTVLVCSGGPIVTFLLAREQRSLTNLKLRESGRSAPTHKLGKP